MTIRVTVDDSPAAIAEARRISAEQEQARAERSHQSEREASRQYVSGHTYSMEVDTEGSGRAGSEHRSNVHKINSEDMRPKGSILDTARNNFGSPIARSELTPDSVVEFQGTQADLRTLELMGEVRRNPITGAYEETNPQGQSPDQSRRDTKPTGDGPQSAPPADHEGNLGEEAEALVSKLVSGDRDYAISLHTEAADAVAEGKDLNIAPDKLAAALGLDNAMAAEGAAASLRDAFQSKWDNAMAKEGIDDFADFTAFAREYSATEVRDATARFIDNADLSGWRSLARAYVASGRNVTNEDLLNADYGDPLARVWEQDGRVYVHTNETGTLDARELYRAAAKSGSLG